MCETACKSLWYFTGILQFLRMVQRASTSSVRFLLEDSNCYSTAVKADRGMGTDEEATTCLDS